MKNFLIYNLFKKFYIGAISNAIRKQGIDIINATQKGNKFSQHKVDNWSNLNLGKVDLTQTKIKQMKQVFNPNIIDCKFSTDSFTNNSGKLYPPKKKIEVIQLNNTIEEYSPKKKNTKGTDECSVKNPATNSDSASCKSKGVLEVSARTAIK